MRRTFRVHWGRPGKNRLTLLWLCVLAALLAAGVPAFAEEASPEPSAAERAEIERMRSELRGAEKAGEPITCTDTTIRGKFEDLVSYYYERKDGYAGWRVSPDAEACLQASTLACVDTHIVILKLWSDTGTNKNSTVSRWQASAALAEVLGHEVQILFSSRGGSWPVCQVDRFYVFH